MIAIHVDLRGLLGNARDQGARPTCLAFAASDAHAALREGWTPLSCEFAFYQAQRITGRNPVQGALLSSMIAALRTDGQPDEQGWPYLAAVPADQQLWKPPASVGICYGRNGAAAGATLASVVASLDQGQPVVMLMTLSRCFFLPDRNGVVDPAKDEYPEPSQRHAVVAVGHGSVDGAPAVLIRNSWGASWGISGHAWLTEQFLKPRLFATANLLEEVDVSSSAVPA